MNRTLPPGLAFVMIALHLVCSLTVAGVLAVHHHTLGLLALLVSLAVPLLALVFSDEEGGA